MSEQEIRQILAAKLREYRELNGFTTRQVGEAIGKSEKTISAWERGRGQPDADMLLAICTLYNIKDIGVFYGMGHDGITLTPGESELLSLYRSVTAAGQDHILSTARMVAGNPDMLKGGSAGEAIS